EHQLEFPQQILKVSTHRQDGARGATTSSAQRPPGPTLLQPADEEGKQKGGPLQDRSKAGGQQDSPQHTAIAADADFPQSSLAP
ncbi:Hypothetical predicted protein, partial [Marmota monax]